MSEFHRYMEILRKDVESHIANGIKKCKSEKEFVQLLSKRLQRTIATLNYVLDEREQEADKKRSVVSVCGVFAHNREARTILQKGAGRKPPVSFWLPNFLFLS